MNATPEPEAELRLQASSPAQDYRSQGGAQGAAETRQAQASATGGQIAEESERAQGGQEADRDGVNTLGNHPTQRGGQRGGQSNGGGDDLEAKREATGEQPIGEIGDRGEQSPQAPTEGGQNRVGKDVEMRKHPGYLQADKGKRLGGQGVRDRVGKTGEKGEQPSHDGVGVNGAWGGRLARVISLASIHPTPRAWVGNAATPENPTSDDTISGEQPADGQAANWLKSLLPEPQSGWWEVQAKGKGFAVKFRWRGTDRQTLLFPQITGAQFVVLKESISGEAARILRKRITASLHSFLLDPDKRDKALVVARKLEIELEIVRRPE